MSTREQILKLLKRKPASGAGLARRLRISRQAVNASLRELVLSGQVIKTGATRGALYAPASARSGLPVASFAQSFKLKGLAEDDVFRLAVQGTQLSRGVAPNVRDIIQYGFTAMLNNAIEHSRAHTCGVRIWLDPYACSFIVRDPGIGLFRSIATKFGLRDENAAVGELLKGKTTTMAERHSGEGIFFTARAGEIVSFRSHRIELVFDARKEDVVVAERRFLRGTEVRFQISRRSRRRLERIFEEHAPADLDYRFEKTHVFVKLYRGEYVSRSEARRMLARLDKFKIVELDFRGVKSLGQGFADEVFRVFAASHPRAEIRIVNLVPGLEPMVRHVVDNDRIKQLDDSLTIVRALPDHD